MENKHPSNGMFHNRWHDTTTVYLTHSLQSLADGEELC
jgi:hypothetical protein